MTSPKNIILMPAIPADLIEGLSSRYCVKGKVGSGDFTGVSDTELGKIDGIIAGTRIIFDAARFDTLPRLKVVSNFAVGTDNVDLPEATRRGILVCNTPGVLDNAVADLTLALILASGRRIATADRFVRDGAWVDKRFVLASDVTGKTLGVLGLGRIGKQVAKRARAFDMQVLYHQPRRDLGAEASGLARYVERDILFAQSDWLSLHVPDRKDTRSSVGAAEFALMKPSAILVNTARGSIVDYVALVAALQTGQIGGAALDVMDPEPIGGSDVMTTLPNVLLTPHIGSATVETRRAMIELAIANLDAALAGERPPSLVNPAVMAGR